MAHLAHYKEAHPLIFVVTHWINLIAMIMLILSAATLVVANLLNKPIGATRVAAGAGKTKRRGHGR